MSTNLQEPIVGKNPVAADQEFAGAREVPDLPPDPPVAARPARRRRRRGPWIALLAVVVVAALVGVMVLVLAAGLVFVSGTVIDARTALPLAEVTVSGGDEIVTTVEDGSFTVMADSGAMLSFAARGYEPGESVAAESLVVRLDPVVLSGSVTSMLTGEGLPAVVTSEGVDVGSADSSGTLTAYAVTTGDRVVVTAAGYLPAEVAVREGDLDVRLQPEWPTSVAQIQEWVDAGSYGKALGWLLRDDLDVPLVRDSSGQGIVDEGVSNSSGVFAAGRSTTPIGSNDFVDAYVVAPGRVGEATSAWTKGDADAFRIEGQRVLVGRHWDDTDVVVTMWWMDPVLVIAFTDTALEGEDVITAVMRGQGLDIDSFADDDARPARA